MHFQYPFLTDEVFFQNGETIKAGENKFKIREECFAEPDHNKDYFIFGKILTEIVDEIRLDRHSTLKEGLKYSAHSGDYFLFNTENIIADSKDWEGLSGSPVISIDGECVGVLCSVLEGSQSIWVMPIAKVKMLIEVIIQEERLNINTLSGSNKSDE